MMIETKNGRCVSLQPAQPTDLEAILVLLERAHLPTAGVAQALSQFIVAVNEGRIVGVAGLEIYDQSALLRSVAVEESWRGTGVGGLLIDRALSMTRARGVKDVFLLTTTADHYFPRFGFACISRDSVADEVRASAEFQGACPASAVVMHKALQPA
jgi:amino-acid N-acetyltransferase